MQEVNQKVKECIAKAEARFGRTFKYPTIDYKLRGVAAGRAYYYGNHIKLNPVLLHENRETFIKQTVPHEVAHLIAFQVYGSRIRPHGKEWASVMNLFGCPANRCHSYDVTPAHTRKTYEVKCGCKTHSVTSIRYNRMVKGISSYKCVYCKQTLRLANSSLVSN